MERMGMARHWRSAPPGDGIDHQVEGRHEHRSRQRFEEMMEPPVEFAEEGARLAGKDLQLLDQDPLHRGHQRGMNAVAHDIANQHARLRIGDLDDGEEIAPDERLGQVAVGETEGARASAAPRGKEG
jgi:hypothetical protein